MQFSPTPRITMNVHIRLNIILHGSNYTYPYEKKQTYEIIRNRRKPYKTVENRSNSDIFRRICMVNFYGLLRFHTDSYSFVQFPTFTILTGKICYGTQKIYESQ